ncbi:serine/threonine protein kinase [Anabaenopsis elenkinii]|uniref:non-specific serine/threonine protein kinase n=1 Tax=Anabaenopsis elenkinii CCIBt3563 TaxID=2779889 RepID=A0A7S6U6S2_9CYAN|nr:serine/threonine-protein kinase [Anabaenopsis elenkinii]QOV23667.1 serine/threonine protein kinase [Anabaenopsis elenkinii CCIBt3563]QOV23668.1 serine/threonine protein kinase [Anabaenopsis elenkinii CCIBt3563]
MNYPDFTPQGYEVIRELGRNREGGRIAWLASQLQTGQQVVIKQFCFAQTGSSWSAYKEHEREIQVLKGLKHPGIPEYLGAFATDDGFCLVQEYKNAQSLAVQRSFDPQEIKHIAVKVLEILVYLQNRIPPVIHRDVKPENILVDDQLNVYLIDFGMSRIGSQEVAASSVFQGTPGFIPPEQLRKPTEGSDLYGLGATLICLLTGKKSTQIQDLTDEDDPYVIHFRNLLPRLSPRFLGWLELMVKPRLKERFADAQTALEGLKPLDVVRVPEVKLSTSVIELTATRIGERLKQPIEVVNTMSETLLEGKWEVAPHPQDPPHTPDSHGWIVVSPREFKNNQINCDVWVDTSKLMADKFYERQLWLRSNADVEVHSLTVRVKTAPLPIERRSVPYLGLVSSLLSFAGLSYAGYVFVSQIEAGFWAEIGAGIVAGIAAVIATLIYAVVRAEIWSGIGAGGIGSMFGAWIGAWMGGLIGAGIVAVIVAVIRAGIEPVIKFGGEKLGLFTAGLGITGGIALAVGTLHPYILLALLATGLPFATMVLYPFIQRRKLIAQYRRSEEHLIKP